MGAGQNEVGFFILLDRTIFHPQGGGQPSDQGVLRVADLEIPIHLVKKVGELSGFQLTKCKVKGKTLKVGYDVGMS